MLQELRIRLFSLQIKQRIVWGLLIGLVTFSFGLAVAFLSFDHSVIVNEAMKIQDQLTYEVVRNGGS